MFAAMVIRSPIKQRVRAFRAALLISGFVGGGVSAGSCYEPQLADCAIACGTDGRCPSGQHCDQGFCTGSRHCADRTSAAGGAGGVPNGGADAGPDASAGSGGSGAVAGGADAGNGNLGNGNAGRGGATGDQALGASCTTGAACESGNCVDDRCCSTPACGQCQTCGNDRGTCAQIKGVDDPDSCSGTRTCDGAAICANRVGPTAEFTVPTANSRPESIAVGPDSALWFTEAQGNRIGRITTSGSVTEFEIPTADSFPGSITMGPDGALWFTERCPSRNGKIGRITRTGEFSEFDVTTLGTPLEITTGSDGNLWFTKQSLTETHAIDRMTPSGSITEFPLSVAGSIPGDITPGPDAGLWFTESASAISEITTSGTITRHDLGTPAQVPFGIATGPDGNLWATVQQNIGRFMGQGAIDEYRLLTSDVNPDVAHYITAGPDGNLWFTATGANVIGRITPRGLIREFGVPTANANPWDIATGPEGNLWFTEPLANKIGRFTPPPLAIVLSGDGDGKVLSSGGEIDCGITCSHRMTSGKTITLTATAGPDSFFTGWFGGGCSGTGSCTVESAVTVTATFQGRHNFVFVTSTQVAAGELQGLAGADAICQDRAAAAHLTGTYVAWLSTSAVDAKDRLGAARGWIRPDGRPFADSVDDLLHGKIFYPPRVDEFGIEIPVSDDEIAITGTGADGMRYSTGSDYCTDWTDATSGVYLAGSPWGGTGNWTGGLPFKTPPCATPGRLYCFGVDDATPLQPARVSGRVAFIQDTQFVSDGGVPALDGACQNAAAANGIAGDFRAMVATTTTPAAERFSTAGEPWVRPDGIPIADTAARLFDGTPLLAPTTMSATGGYRSFCLLSGAPTPTDLATENCFDWTTVPQATLCGFAGMTTSTFFDWGETSCFEVVVLRCLQE